MRLLRAITAVFGAAAMGAVALPGQAGAAPVAPYTALTMNGRFSFALDAGESSVYQGVGSENFEYINFTTSQSGHTASIQIVSKVGTKITPGAYPAVAGNGTATAYGLGVSGDGYSCAGSGGASIVINSVTRTGAGAIDSISASYIQCHEMYGEFRWNSAHGYTDALQTTNSFDFGLVTVGRASAPKTVTFTSIGSAPLQPGAVTFAGAAAASWKVDTNGCAGKTLTYGQTCSVGVSALAQAEGELHADLKLADNSARGFRSVGMVATGVKSSAGNFVPVGPTRILDTRSGLGAVKGRLGPQKTLSLQVAGVGGLFGVPESGVSAVMLNVTVANATSGSFLSAFPGGTARPTVSNLNFAAGWVGANSVTVPLGANGKVDIYNELGSVDVIADVLGYYFAGLDTLYQDKGGQFQPHNTFRAADTRDPGWGGPLPGGWSMPVVLDYNLTGDHNRHVRALAVNVTAVSPQGFGYLTAWNGLNQPPLASTLNFTANTVVPNFAVVPTSTCTIDPECAGMPEIDIFNGSAKPTHVIVDVVGYFDDAQDGPGFRFHPLTPSRIGDTRTQLGGPGTLGPNSTATFTVPAAARTELTGALVTNVTGVNRGGAWTYLTAYAAGDPKPFASNINLAPYDVRPNAAFVLLGSNSGYTVYNAASTADVIVDVAGRFDYYPYPLPLGASSTGAVPKRSTPVAGPVHRYTAG